MRLIPFNREVLIGESVVIGEIDGKHLAKVLRFKKGDIVKLYTPSGRVFLSIIEDVHKNDVTVIVKSREADLNPPSNKLTIVQGILKSERFEWVLQKSCELGVFSIIPFISKRTVCKPDANKIERWGKIITAASKQSGNPYPPKLNEISTFDKALKKLSDEFLKIIFYEEGGKSLKDILTYDNKMGNVALIIGSEGGFERDEIELAMRNNCIVSSLGWRILRGETAAITSISIAQYYLGELG